MNIMTGKDDCILKGPIHEWLSGLIHISLLLFIFLQQKSVHIYFFKKKVIARFKE